MPLWRGVSFSDVVTRSGRREEPYSWCQGTRLPKPKPTSGPEFKLSSSVPLSTCGSQARLQRATLTARMKCAGRKPPGRVHTDAPLQMPYLARIKRKQRLGALSGPDRASEFFSFTNPDKRPGSNKPQRGSSYSGASRLPRRLLEAARRKESQPEPNAVWNSIEHQSILITAMLTIRGGGGGVFGRKVVRVCVYLVAIVCCVEESVKGAVRYRREAAAENGGVGGRRYRRRACCASGHLSFFAFLFFSPPRPFFRSLCAEARPNGNRCCSSPSRWSGGKRKKGRKELGE